MGIHAIAETYSQKAFTDTAPSANKKSPNSSCTTVARPPWGATPSAAAAVIRRRDARSLRLSSPGIAIKASAVKAGSPGSIPNGARASAPVAAADLGSAGAASLSTRRHAKRLDGAGSDGDNTPRYLKATAAAAAKMSKSPKSGPTSAVRPPSMRLLLLSIRIRLHIHDICELLTCRLFITLRKCAVVQLMKAWISLSNEVVGNLLI